MNKEKEVAPAHPLIVVNNEINVQAAAWPFTKRAQKFKVDLICQIITRYLGHRKCYHHKHVADSIAYAATTPEANFIQGKLDWFTDLLVERFEQVYYATVHEFDMGAEPMSIESYLLPTLDPEKHRFLEPVDSPALVERRA